MTGCDGLGPLCATCHVNHPLCDDRLNIMRIRREIDFVNVKLKDADAF